MVTPKQALHGLPALVEMGVIEFEKDPSQGNSKLGKITRESSEVARAEFRCDGIRMQAELDEATHSATMGLTNTQNVLESGKPWRTVASILASVASYGSMRYRLRKRPVQEGEGGKRSDTFTGYPGNHNYAIQKGQLVPCFQLFERFQKVSSLLTPEMDSFLDVGCCRGFYVLQCALRPGCRLAVGVDVFEPFVSDAQRAMRCQRLENCGWHVATLEDLALNPPGFGGPFHTILNIGTYHYIYWGSNLCSTAFFDHREILHRFASLCTDRFIISARFEVDRLPSFVRATAQFHEKQKDYTTRSFLNAAAEFFDVRHHGFLGTYPLLLLRKR